MFYRTSYCSDEMAKHLKDTSKGSYAIYTIKASFGISRKLLMCIYLTINIYRDWKRSSGRLESWEGLLLVLLRTPIIQMIFFNPGMLLLGSNHFLNKHLIHVNKRLPTDNLLECKETLEALFISIRDGRCFTKESSKVFGFSLHWIQRWKSVIVCLMMPWLDMDNYNYFNCITYS